MKFLFIIVIFSFISCNYNTIASKYEVKSEFRCPRQECYYSIQARTPNMYSTNWKEIYKAETQGEAEEWVRLNINSKEDIKWKVDSATRSNGIYKQF